MQGFLKKTVNFLVPILLGAAILWWMYRDFNFTELMSMVRSDMNWWWMAFSLVFGVLAQVFRGVRWRLTLEPLGEHPKMSHLIHAIFLSYAASLVIPRIGEVTRCGVLKRYDGTSFPKALGTVVTERIIDSLLLLVIFAAVILLQLPVFKHFFESTGVSIGEWLHGFTATGYLVTGICVVVTVVFLWFVLRKMALAGKVRDTLSGLKQGVLSLRDVRQKGLFVFYTLAIWVSYFLHFYIAFFCFPFMQGLGLMAALVSFVVGGIAVIVPTPNGMGPWHFAVKTILVLYGVEAVSAGQFVLIVHTVQTALIPVLGIFSLFCLHLFAKPKENVH